MKYDFCGWATLNDLKCSDGRTIRHGAFSKNDGSTVPLVWNHEHTDIENVLGHALLEERDRGMYAYCSFNDTERGQNAKKMVEHGDLLSLSIYANQLQQNGGNVLKGNIREVSLVHAGANPGAVIESVMLAHGDGTYDELDDEAVIYTGENLELVHADEPAEEKKEEKEVAENSKKTGEKTIADIIETMTDEQKQAMYAIIGMALEDKESGKGEEPEMKHNVFDNDDIYEGDVLMHMDMSAILADAKRNGSLKEAFLAHADDEQVAATYGIADIDWLFPEPKNLNTPPAFIKRKTEWVNDVMNGVSHTPFSRIKSMFADITADEARARGYMKGNRKKEEVFTLLKRSTDPQTVYKKQKLDRDDVIDITDFDVIAWIKGEMRMMLDEELARAILIGDGRLSDSDDKISEDHVRSVLNDDALFTIRKTVAPGANGAAKAKNFIDTCIRARKEYKGSGRPALFTTEDMLTEMLLVEDGIGHKLYKSESELATTLRVSKIVTVEVMENCKDKDGYDVLGIIVNLSDYKVGADKGGAVNLFDDFDIDYNQMKYLIETRCSGALVVPYSAIALLEAGSQSSNDNSNDNDDNGNG